MYCLLSFVFFLFYFYCTNALQHDSKFQSLYKLRFSLSPVTIGGRCRDRMVVGFTITYASHL